MSRLPKQLVLFASGVFLVSLFPKLPSIWWLLAFALLLVALSRYACIRLIIFFYTGVCWGVFSGHQMMNAQLSIDDELAEYDVKGSVISLPNVNERRVRFEFEVHEVHRTSDGQPLPLNKLLLSWYDSEQQIVPGQQWQLRVKLRRPRNFSNPASFDYRGWLMSQGISATGYVRANSNNRLFAEEYGGLSSWRISLREKIQASNLGKQRFLAALVVGDGSGLSGEDWRRLRLTGTTHLLVISGLHIGFVATLCYALGILLGRFVNLQFHQIPTPLVASVFSLVGAVLYSGLAGLGLPAIRALVMVAVVLLVRLLRTRISFWCGLAFAAAVIAFIDPLAIHSLGFWLSFGAVTALLWGMTGLWGLIRWRRFWLPQWLVFLALSGPILIGFGDQTVLSPLVNAVAIPWVSLLIVPLCLLGAIFSWLPVVSDGCWRLANWQLEYLWELLGVAEQYCQDFSVSLPLAHSLTLFLTLALATGLLILPKGFPARWLGIVPVFCLFFAKQPRAELQVTTLDVGQGLAVVVQTPNHTLLYDTGARFSDRFDAGSGIVVPWLRSQGIGHLDKLMISHSDNDHAGGERGVLESISVSSILKPQADQGDSVSVCRAGMHWQWDGVLFEVLHPDSQMYDKTNNESCVLAIHYQGQIILLPGDIEATVENQLATSGVLPRNITLLIAPHHGSKTSSTPTFVNATRPDSVVFSTGYRHQFGHPHASVVDRYQHVGSKAYNTAYSGAVTFRYDAGNWTVFEHRRELPYYWQ
ncbi:DNA internalization-related competence protein ComEC/Rec2 [Porticoccaceae bacterium LTM1]|nr:DNA internalization-related competence protein ComEC/Rec2 [Porticoccaceae bacterium LTM1]